MAGIHERPAGVTGLACFFVFAALLSALIAMSLLFPGTPLDDLWKASPDVQFGFKHLGGFAVLLMFIICVVCLCVAVGLWRYQRWGFTLAITVLGVNMAADLISAALRHDWRSLAGIPVSGAMIFYLVQELRRHRQQPREGQSL
jgi:hypothetical protein